MADLSDPPDAEAWIAETMERYGVDRSTAVDMLQLELHGGDVITGDDGPESPEPDPEVPPDERPDRGSSHA